MTEKPASSYPLDGQTAVVTGAAQGLGLAMVERLARDGHEVTVLVREASLKGFETWLSGVRRSNADCGKRLLVAAGTSCRNTVVAARSDGSTCCQSSMSSVWPTNALKR